MRILIAETDSALLYEMRCALKQAGYEVTVADNGMTAWQHLTGREPPNILVTRFHLGAGTPPGTALGCRAHSCHPPIPVVYIPANAEQATHADPGHGTVLIKPFSGAELIAAVKRLLDAPACDHGDQYYLGGPTDRGIWKRHRDVRCCCVRPGFSCRN